MLYSRGGGVASAIPCTPTAQQSIAVSPSSALNVSSLFDCEGGVFDVTWSGVVNIQSSIVIGTGTTVSIAGDHVSNVTIGLSSDSAGTSSAVNNTGSSAVVATDVIGPLFVVQRGVLNLEGISVRGGSATVTAGLGVISGGGVSAEDANVTVTGCTFEENFAEWVGGGIFANRSRVEIRDTAFRVCAAGAPPVAGEVDYVEGSGGGVGVRERAIARVGSEACRSSSNMARLLSLCDSKRRTWCGKRVFSPTFSAV